MATVLTPRGKFMPSFLKNNDGSLRSRDNGEKTDAEAAVTNVFLSLPHLVSKPRLLLPN